MNGPPKVDHPETTEDDGGLDPREAAALIEETARQARRQFQPHAPYVAVLGAGVFLFGYGAVWWSMRNQHPYTTGPAGWSIALLYALIIVSAIASSQLLTRPTAGVGGRAAGSCAVWPSRSGPRVLARGRFRGRCATSALASRSSTGSTGRRCR